MKNMSCYQFTASRMSFQAPYGAIETKRFGGVAVRRMACVIGATRVIVHLLVHYNYSNSIQGERMPSNTIHVILADDHAVVRKGIREFLLEPGDIDVMAEAADGDEAVALIDQLRPDVAVLDIKM